MCKNLKSITSNLEEKENCCKHLMEQNKEPEDKSKDISIVVKDREE